MNQIGRLGEVNKRAEEIAKSGVFVFQKRKRFYRMPFQTRGPKKNRTMNLKTLFFVALTAINLGNAISVLGETVIIESRSGSSGTGSNNPLYTYGSGFSATPSTVKSTASGCTSPGSCRFSTTANATSFFTVSPTLVANATYSVEVTLNSAIPPSSSAASATITATVTTTGTSSATLTSPTSAFQGGGPGSNNWALVGSIVPNTTTPTITFTYAGGTLNTSGNRWNADAIRFIQTSPPPPPATFTLQFWDLNGSSAGTGGTGVWDPTTANWNAASDGTGTPQSYIQTNLSVFWGTAGTVSINAGGIISDGGLQFDVDGYVIQSGPLTLGSGTNLNVTNISTTATISSKISGSNGLIKNGNGTLIISGANDFTGLVTANAGTLKLGASQTFSSLQGFGSLDLGANTLTVGDLSSTTYAGTISDAGAGTPGALIKQGAGTLTLAGISTFNGNITINSGILSVIGSFSMGSGTGAVTLNNGTLQNTAGTVGGNFINSETRPIVIGANGGALDVFAAPAILFYRNGTISGTGNTLTKTGVGTLRLSDTASLPNTHTLVTTKYLVVTAGLLQVGIDTALGEVPGSPLANAITLNGGGISANAAFEINSNRSMTISGTGTLDATSDLTYNGVISGATLTKTGANTLTLGGNNTFNNTLNLTAGTVALGSDNALGTALINLNASAGGIRSADANTRTLADTGKINLLSQNTIFGSPTTGDLIFNGAFNSGGIAKTLTVNNAQTTFNGVISGGSGTTANTKEGSGTLVFAGANTYNKSTVINYGTLKVNNASGSGTGLNTVTVASAGTLGGSGTISGAVTNNGTISPGNSVGTLSTGGEIWAGGGHYTFEINSATGTAGTSPGWDKLNITGGLNITANPGSKFTLDITSLTLANAAGTVSDFDNTASYTWTIAQTTSGITGFDTNAFALTTSGFANSLGGGSFSITNNATDIILKFISSSAQRPASFVTTAAGQGHFTGSPNTTYTVEYANVLATPTAWQFLTSVATDGAGLGTFSDASAPGGQPQRFYRVKSP
jgi:fibronectin-binding autotransporter adhesin